MSDEPPPTPEGKLIGERREAIRPKLSQNAAAQLIGLSGNRWRHIEKGYQTVRAGQKASVVGPTDTVAQMARVVGVTPDELREVGRDDAADALEGMMTVRERGEYTRAGGTLKAKIPGLGAGLASLIPSEEEQREHDAELLRTETEIIAHTWDEARDLVAAVKSLDAPPPELRNVTQRIIFTLSAYLIIRILDGRHSTKLEPWLQRIYTERERLYREVSVGEPQYPWSAAADRAALDLLVEGPEMYRRDAVTTSEGGVRPDVAFPADHVDIERADEQSDYELAAPRDDPKREPSQYERQVAAQDADAQVDQVEPEP